MDCQRYIQLSEAIGYEEAPLRCPRAQCIGPTYATIPESSWTASTMLGSCDAVLSLSWRRGRDGGGRAASMNASASTGMIQVSMSTGTLMALTNAPHPNEAGGRS